MLLGRKWIPETETNKKAMKKRGIWVEPLVATAKQFHRLGCFCLRKLTKVNIEGVLTVVVQILVRWLQFKYSENEQINLN
jgi:hypothetical protein